MGFPDAALSRLVLIRILPGLVILIYLSVIIASHPVPLGSGLGLQLALGGIATVIVVLFVTARPPREWAGSCTWPSSSPWEWPAISP
jgi:hypothetical protein